jgi:glycosyltransferase involved in cell wall biosynthesis
VTPPVLDAIFVLKGYPRLSETFIAQEILGLEQAGLRLHIVALRRPTDTRVHPVHREIKAAVSYLPEYLHEEPLRVLRSAWSLRHNPRMGVLLRTWWSDLRRDISRNRFRRLGQAFVLAAEMPGPARRLHAHFIHTPASVTYYASILTAMPWSCSAHAKDIWTSAPWELAKKLADAEWCVTCTASGKAHLDALAPAEKPVHLLYHGLDFSRFTPLTAPRSARDGSSADQPCQLLTVGRAVEKKGIDLLLAALARLPETLNWRWTHVGGGDGLKKLKKQAAALSLESRITWLGSRDQEAVLEEYRKADVFVLPCRIAGDGDRDGLPNVLMEAQSQSLACVSTTVSAIPELIINGETGLLVPPGDVGALSDALATMIREPALRQRLGRAGARRVAATFSHKKGIETLHGLLLASGAQEPDVVAASRLPAAE